MPFKEFSGDDRGQKRDTWLTLAKLADPSFVVLMYTYKPARGDLPAIAGVEYYAALPVPEPGFRRTCGMCGAKLA